MCVWLCMRFKAGQRETREFGWGNAERFISSSCRVASVAVDDCWTLLCVCVWVLWVSTSLSLFPLSPMRHMLKYKRKKREKKTKQNRKEEEKSYKEREEKREGRTVGGMMMTCWRVSIITLDRIQKKPYFNMFRCAYKRHVQFFLIENTKYKKVKQIHRTERRLFLSREE